MKNSRLEVIRGFAALAVFLCHLCLLNPFLAGKTYLNFFSNWGTEAVIIFFVLSGIVINISSKKKPPTAGQFIIKRLLRLYPIYFLGILLAIFAIKYIDHQPTGMKIILGNLLFLGTFDNNIVSVPKYNPVVWSLTFEVFFYVIFTLRLAWIRINFFPFWIFVSITCIPLYYMKLTGIAGYFIAMFAFSSIWLLGYFTAEFAGNFKRINTETALLFGSALMGISRVQITDLYYDVTKYLVFAIVSIPFFLFAINYNDANTNTQKITISRVIKFTLVLFLGILLIFSSNSGTLSKIFYFFIPLFFYVADLFKINIFHRHIILYLKRTGVWLGSISYALYIVHYPLLALIYYQFRDWGEMVKISFAVIVTFIIAGFLEKIYQHAWNKVFFYKRIKTG